MERRVECAYREVKAMCGFRRALTCGMIASLFLASCVTPRRVEDEAAGRNPARVILIGWDGAQREHVREALGRGELPALRSLIDDGVYEDIDVTGTTDTKAGWAEILTGYGPEVTGVFSNDRFNAIPEGDTIFERLEDRFGKDKIFTAAVIGTDRHVGGDAAEFKRPLTRWEANVVIARNRVAAARRGRMPALPQALLAGEVAWSGGRLCLTSPAEPYYYTSRRVDVWRKGMGTNRAVGEEALAALRDHRDGPFFLFVHFIDIDRAGHEFGENSKAYNDALVSSDEWTGRILRRLEEYGLRGRSFVYVTADHGFDEGRKTHARATRVFLATNDGTVTRSGTRVDVAPTIYRRLGIDASRYDPGLSGRPLN